MKKTSNRQGVETYAPFVYRFECDSGIVNVNCYTVKSLKFFKKQVGKALEILEKMNLSTDEECIKAVISIAKARKCEWQKISKEH